jgi:DNA-binding protein H-NS
MTAEERIAELEQENEQLRAELAEAHQQIAQLAERLQQVEGVWQKIAITVANRLPVMDQHASRAASAKRVARRQEGKQVMSDAR